MLHFVQPASSSSQLKALSHGLKVQNLRDLVTTFTFAGGANLLNRDIRCVGGDAHDVVIANVTPLVFADLDEGWDRVPFAKLGRFGLDIRPSTRKDNVRKVRIVFMLKAAADDSATFHRKV